MQVTFTISHPRHVSISAASAFAFDQMERDCQGRFFSGTHFALRTFTSGTIL